MSDDLISRQAAIDCCRNEWEEEVAERIEALPSVQPQDIARDIATIIENEKDMRVMLKNAQPKRIKGRWIGTDYDGFADGNPVYDEWKCSECGCVVEDEEPTWNYCPNCGADMRGEK